MAWKHNFYHGFPSQIVKRRRQAPWPLSYKNTPKVDVKSCAVPVQFGMYGRHMSKNATHESIARTKNRNSHTNNIYPSVPTLPVSIYVQKAHCAITAHRKVAAKRRHSCLNIDSEMNAGYRLLTRLLWVLKGRTPKMRSRTLFFAHNRCPACPKFGGISRTTVVCRCHSCRTGCTHC